MGLDDFDKPFIWRKKYEEKGIKIDEKEIEAEYKKRVEENKIELEKIKERQRKREQEYQQKLNDVEFLQRQKEAEQHEHWEQQEDDFILRQHKHRSKIRIRDGRAKPIDLLAHYCDVFGAKNTSNSPGNNRKNEPSYLQEEKIDLSDSPVELLNPCDWFNGLRESDLKALEPDIEIYMDADCEQNQQYWKDLLEITRNELSKLQSIKEQSSSNTDVNSAIVTDVMSLFEGKTISELDVMEAEMSDILNDDNPSVDAAFYKGTLSRLRAYRAKVRLTMNHKKNLKRQKDKILEIPKTNLSTNITTQDSNVKQESSFSGREENTNTTSDTELNGNEDEVLDSDDEGEQDDDNEPTPYNSEQNTLSLAKCMEDYDKGKYSPQMYKKSGLDLGVVFVEYEKEYELLCHHRNQVCNASSLDEAKMVTMTSEERAFIDVATKGMDNQEESTFSCEATVRGSDNRSMTYAWADKYQPRKPRYFNRVHTGFEWNKYNQTHYDIDNPPPKVVQGYKFNIFYPDLIDKSKAPTFSITPCNDDKDFCVIRFSAGPPYEDLAFKIVNREWNNSHKSGYRCQFINNILQLWFQFKRYRYRR